LGQIEVNQNWQVTAAVDKDPKCNFPYSWGAMAFTRALHDFMDTSDPHVGYAIPRMLAARRRVIARHIIGEYIDCGTPKEFQRLVAGNFG